MQKQERQYSACSWYESAVLQDASICKDVKLKHFLTNDNYNSLLQLVYISADINKEINK